MKKIIYLIIISFFMPYSAFSQSDNFDEPWKEVAQFEKKTLPKSAEKVVLDILSKAQAAENTPQVIKAQLYLMSIYTATKEDENYDAIEEVNHYIQKSRGVEQALWQSIAASLYWEFYQSNRFQIINRTALGRGIEPSEDYKTWDASSFYKKVGDLYLASLQNPKALQDFEISSFASIVSMASNTEKLRPTLYDLLAFRALSFFQNEEKNLTQPAYKFEIDHEKYFADAATFSRLKLETKDSSSLFFKALKLYQKILVFHLKDESPEALIDADLARLEFVFNQSVLSNNHEVYFNALEKIEQRYKNNAASAEASFRMAKMMMQYPPVVNGEEQKNLVQVRDKLKVIVRAYPESEGGIHAYNLMNGIEAKDLRLKVEETYPSDENVRVLVAYKNIAQIKLRLYQLPNDFEEEDFGIGKKIIKNKPSIREWQQTLPGSEDLASHTTEIKVDQPGKVGKFLLVASQKSNDADEISYAVSFQVTNLSLIKKDDNQGDNLFYVLDRKKGHPIEKARIIFQTREYNRNKNDYDTKTVEVLTDSRGQAEAPSSLKNGYNVRVGVSKGEDIFISPPGLYFTRNHESAPRDEIHTFFFTDRGIYRPGQTIYFKGIMVKDKANRPDNSVVANRKTTIIFYDANNQKVHSLELTTNEFGSFSGAFTAPEGGLTGVMQIANSTGSTYFSVEEYRRPKFFVAYDTLKDNYALNKKIKIKGFAKAYAGNKIDGAEVTYRVVRKARFPYRWAYYYWGEPFSLEMEIANGTTTTDVDGSFVVAFETIPDRSIDAKTLPIFSYTVYAEVTDLNGETRSGNQTINVGYRSLLIQADVPEQALKGDLKEVSVSTRNLNGVFYPSKLKASVAQLEQPDRFLRSRLWPLPDQFVLSEKEFRKAFPLDEYKQESDYRYWREQKVLYTKEFTTEPDGKITLPPKNFEEGGWYVVKFEGKDTEGNKIEEKQYVYVVTQEKYQKEMRPFVVMANKKVFEPGDQVSLWLNTPFKDAFIFQLSSLNGRNVDGVAQGYLMNRKIEEKDRGGIRFNWFYIYQNRTYEASEGLSVPWTNKELHLEWESLRDKSLPGAEETWTVTIKGDKKEQVAAEMLAGMYDASLDAFRRHNWVIQKLLPSLRFNPNWMSYGFSSKDGYLLDKTEGTAPRYYIKTYSYIKIPDSYLYAPKPHILEIRNEFAIRATLANGLSEGATERERAAQAAPVGVNSVAFSQTGGQGKVMEGKAGEGSEQSAKDLPEQEVQVRTNLNETAFFFPELRTDAEGRVKFTFTLPEALTTWRFMALGHTKDWETGYTEGSIQTQKDLMVIPNLPRFLRQGDDLVISTKISNLSDQQLEGTATLEILDAQTLNSVDLPFRLTQKGQNFQVKKGQSTSAEWSVHVPENFYLPVVIRIIAKAGAFSDGEESTLPVVSNRRLVTETMPLPMRGTGSKNFSFSKLLHSDTLKGYDNGALAHHALTVEFTGNPTWYAVQALPYLIESPYECSEQIFSRFYANALAGHIVAQSPKVEAIFKKWEKMDTAALLSNLEKNQELKVALAEETPWVLDGRNETEQKHRIALLFQTHKLKKGLKKNLNKLAQMQLPEGGFPWFEGMRGNRYLTQYIVTGAARLQHLGVNVAEEKPLVMIVDKALPYLDKQIKEDYDHLIKYKVNLNQRNLQNSHIQYFYMRSFYPDRELSATQQVAYNYYKNQMIQYWQSFTPYMKGMIALALDRMGDSKTAATVMQSLKETAVHQEEMGMYWKEVGFGYNWYQAKIEAQALLIEAFAEVEKDKEAVEELKVWLIKQKQTQNWRTTTATADAIYALLLQGSDWLTSEPKVTIRLGKSKTINTSPIKTEAGSGYFKERIEGEEVTSDMGHITVSVDKENSKEASVSWGAVYWQYFEDLDKITSAETPLKIKKELFIERHSENGPVLTRIKEGNSLKIGDKVKVRIILRADRDMDYVHLKDMRAACFEPVNVLSGYRYQNGLGYYENTGDLSTNFFFDYLRKGTYVFEYPVFVGQEGDFSNGISTIQCQYAPEFSSHSEGLRVKVK